MKKLKMIMKHSQQQMTVTKEPSMEKVATGWMDGPTVEFAMRAFTLNLQSLHRRHLNKLSAVIHSLTESAGLCGRLCTSAHI